MTTENPKKLLTWAFYLYVACTVLIVGTRLLVPSASLEILQKEPLATYLIIECGKVILLGLFAFLALRNFKLAAFVLALLAFLFAYGNHASVASLTTVLLISLRIIDVVLGLCALVLSILLWRIQGASRAQESVGIQVGRALFGTMTVIGIAGCLLPIVVPLLCSWTAPDQSACADIAIPFFILLVPSIIILAIGLGGRSMIKRRGTI